VTYVVPEDVCAGGPPLLVETIDWLFWLVLGLFTLFLSVGILGHLYGKAIPPKLRPWIPWVVGGAILAFIAALLGTRDRKKGRALRASASRLPDPPALSPKRLAATDAAAEKTAETIKEIDDEVEKKSAVGGFDPDVAGELFGSEVKRLSE